MMTETIFIDTNILIRFLRADHPQLSRHAKEIFEKAETGKIKIYLDELIVAETVWLLSSFYKLKKEEIARRMQDLISQDWIINPRKKIILEALSLFSKAALAYIDCWIIMASRDLKLKLKTFDKKLKKLAS